MRHLMRNKVELVLLGFVLFLLLLFAAFLDHFGGATLMPRVMAFFVVAGLAVAGLLALAGHRRSILWTVGLYALALVALRLTPLSPVKPFRAFYQSLKPGMSEAAVLDELAERFPDGGRFSRPAVYRPPDTERLSFTLDRTDGRYNSEIVTLKLADGHVVSKDYLPD